MMAENKDYSAMTLAELMTSQKQVKRSEILNALWIGFVVGIMLFGWYRKGFGLLHTVIPILLIAAASRNWFVHKKTKEELIEEISKRTAK